MAYNLELNGLQLKSDDGKDILSSDFKVQIKELDTYKRTFWAVGSDETQDRDKDFIRVAGWNLKNYIKSPRGLWMHDYYEHPHFKTLEIKKDNKEKRLIFQPQFDTHERATLTFNQFANGFLDDFSVGFIPGEFSWNNENDTWGGGRDFTKNHELLEISAVTVPSNPSASIMRSMGLLPENQVSLLAIGYKDEFTFNKGINSYWYPINLNMDAYKQPKKIKLSKGLTVVKAISRFEKEEAETIIGYLFDKSIFNSEKTITNWIDSQLLVKPTKKFYQIGFNEEKSELDISVVDEKIELTIKIEEDKIDGNGNESSTGVIDESNKDLSTSDMPPGMMDDDEMMDDDKDVKYCACEEFNVSEEDAEKCKGCGGRKPKAADPAEPDEDDKSKTLEEELPETLKSYVQKFDKANDDRVKDIVTELNAVKVEVGEIKRLFVDFIEMNKKNDLEELSDDQFLDLSELNLSLVSSPVPKDESDSEKIQIDSETFKQVSKDAVLDAIGDVFKKIFEQEKNKLSGKLED
jgi:HK97 family phage prohead protease